MPRFNASTPNVTYGPVGLVQGLFPRLQTLVVCDVPSAGPLPPGRPLEGASGGDRAGKGGRGGRGQRTRTQFHALAGAVAVFVLSLLVLLVLGLQRRRPHTLAKPGFAL